jgi:hypothetical protein
LGLDADECGIGRDETFPLEVLEAAHETEEMTSRADRRKDVAWSPAAEIAEGLESGDLVALHPVGIDGVHEGDAQPFPDLEAGPEEIAVVAFDLDQTGGENGRRAEAGHRGALFDKNERLQAGPGAVGRRGSGHVPRRDRSDAPGAEGHGLLDGHGGAPVLEAAGGILGFVFRVDSGQSERGAQPVEAEERRRPFAQAQSRVDRFEGQEIRELFDRERPVIVEGLFAGPTGDVDEQRLAASGAERGVGIARSDRAAHEAFEPVHDISPDGSSPDYKPKRRPCLSGSELGRIRAKPDDCEGPVFRNRILSPWKIATS